MKIQNSKRQNLLNNEDVPAIKEQSWNAIEALELALGSSKRRLVSKISY
jgi:hypothetical protein